MLNSYAQVSLMYVRRPAVWFGIALTAFMTFCLVMLMSDLQNNAEGKSQGFNFNVSYELLLIWIPMALVACLMGEHLREQFIPPAARLAPRFLRPHLAVAGLISALFCVVMPLIMSFYGGVSPLGFVAAASVIWACYLCWSFLSPELASIHPLLNAAGLFVPMIAFPPVLWYVIVVGQPALAALLLVLAWTALAWLGWRAAGLQDGREAYWRMGAIRADVGTAAPVSRTGGWGRFLALETRRDRAVARLKPAEGSFWRGVQARRMATTIPWEPWILSGAGFLCAVIVSLASLADARLTTLTILGFSFRDAIVIFVHVAYITQLLLTLGAIFLSVLRPLEAWRSRRGALWLEMMAPVARRRILLESAAALAADLGSYGLGVTAVALFGAVDVIVANIAYGKSVNEAVSVFVPWLVQAVITQWGFLVLAWGWGLWWMRYRSQISWVVSLGFLLGLDLCGAHLLPMYMRLEGKPSSFLLVVVGGIALGGLLLGADAHRRWLAMDLD